MDLLITDNKGVQHTLIAEYIKMIEFSRKSAKIIWKDRRSPDLDVNISQIIFVDGRG